MSDEREETVEDVIAEMRDPHGMVMAASLVHGDNRAGEIESWAARLTAALAREREAVLKVARFLDTSCYDNRGNMIVFSEDGLSCESATRHEVAAELRRAVGRE